MFHFAPSSAEAGVVIAVTVIGVVAALGLLAALVLLRRTGRLATAPHSAAPPRRRRGLTVLFLGGSVALWFGGRIDFAAPGRVGPYTLFEMHGAGDPAYWVAYQVGSYLLILLSGLLLRYRATLRTVLGPPALLVAVLLNTLLLAVYLKLERIDSRLMPQKLAGVTPDADQASDASLASTTTVGWGLAVLGVVLLTAVVVLVLADRYELPVLVAATAAVTVLAAPVMPDVSYWGQRADGSTEHVMYTPFEIGGPAFLWPPLLVLMAALVCVIPVLPKWVRGFATVLAVLSPVLVGVVSAAVYGPIEETVSALLREDGFRVAATSLGMVPYLLMFAALVLVPVAAVRGWRAGRRGGWLRPS
ncbi:hypothetical protein Val02_04910 [Virgisporangium aliadipatigenens]|uniref:Uncharacterized protein n=1 Tax=Virgisporangium aliadipatigenens TaxID=741659 RepID=A0A8J3YGJ6_9ACTN|nr:hypothetical protein [Virgisporangium aliadipatigenens]GIJ43605.1 hypothetical protein Val02_04910 [Virgisporangium aliadipatigenens]